MANAKIHPEGSILLKTLSNIEKNLFWAKFWGWLCMPVCCMGCICIIPAKVYEELIIDLKKIIKLYTPKKLEIIAKDISREQSIFIDACIEINKTCEQIYPNTTLYDALCVTIPNFKTMIGISSRSRDYVSNVDKVAADAYASKAYSVYIEKGGDINSVIYGLPEYLCTIYDPTCDTMSNLYKKIYTNTQLSQYVLSHKRQD